jgi:glycosyltransferase involved in cell wall biosynthesis
MPLVSVIIPTHNRARYAIPTIHAILAISSEIEIVVSDTSDVDQISFEFKNHPEVNRIKFLRPSSSFNVVENFNYALNEATGDYLAFIGDDDFISSRIMDVAKWALVHDIDAIKFTFPALFYWNDFVSSTRWKALANTISISSFTGKVKRHDAKQALTYALDNFGGGVYDMPRAYAGMLSRKLAEKICSKYGALFGGVSPDIYSAALISVNAEDCVLIDFPVIVPGASGASTSGQSANGKHVGGLRDNAHIGAFKNLVWDDRIPEFYGVETVWSYSLLKAAEKVPSLLSAVNFPKLYVKCLIFHSQYSSYIKAAVRVRAKEVGWSQLFIDIMLAATSELFRISSKVRTKFFPSKSVESFVLDGEIPDTFQAYLMLENYLATAPIKLTFCKPF